MWGAHFIVFVHYAWSITQGLTNGGLTQLMLYTYTLTYYISKILSLNTANTYYRIEEPKFPQQFSELAIIFHEGNITMVGGCTTITKIVNEVCTGC